MLNTPPTIPAPWADNGDKAHIPLLNAPTGRATWSEGWSPVNSQPLNAGGIPPNRLDFNAVLFALSAHEMWQQSGGMYAWNAELDYVPLCHVWYNSTLYVAVGNSGPGYGGAVAPSASGGPWRTFADYVVGVNNFANISLSNVNSVGSTRMAAAAMPRNGINISLPQGGSYTAPAPGWVNLDVGAASAASASIALENSTVGIRVGAEAVMQSAGVPVIVPVDTGHVVRNASVGSVTVYSAKFFYAKG